MSKPRILALSASLRNARWGKGISKLLDQISTIEDRDTLHRFLADEAQIHFQQFLDAGRSENIPFDQLCANLRKMSGQKGLCNSEVGMVAALWAAKHAGCEIGYAPLSTYFDTTGRPKRSEQLRKRIMSADGLLFCTPVYFGDRSSLASDFIETVHKDDELSRHLAGKPMGGVAVGAKRNGGQETTLIYALLEMTSIGMLGIGNDSETTSQYGGTIKAGDIGTAVDDSYGLDTAMGVGRRLARVVIELASAKEACLTGRLRVLFWILQDADQFALDKVRRLIELAGDRIEPHVMEVIDGDIGRCLACDICPTHVGPDIEYRCTITRSSDKFSEIHEGFLDHDLVVPVVLSLRNRSKLRTVYQRFLERTRYLRRGDYLFTDVSVMPLVFEEVGATENMHIRMLTSMVRHHTVLLKPNIGYLHRGHFLNWDEVVSDWHRAMDMATQITIGRLSFPSRQDLVNYNPVGYVLSVAADQELSLADRHQTLQGDRERRKAEDAKARIKRP